ncbi:MAG: NAD(P)-dependent oxidoreductase, partial [Pseudomonadota bacterium]
SAAKAARLADAATVAATPAEAVDGAGLVVLMLEDGGAVGEVLFERGAAAAAERGALVVDMSSIDPPRARAHAARLAALGLRAVDAPVSGGEAGAIAGTLSIMAGGAAEDVAAAAAALAPLGRVTHVGPAGAGQTAKLANQMIVGVTIGAVAEAFALVRAAGGDLEAARAALLGGFARSAVLEAHGRRMIDGDYAPGGPARVQRKDLDNALAAAAEAGARLPLTERAAGAFRALVDEMAGGELDHAAYALWLARENGAGGTD